MPNIASLLKEEISRLARKEIKTEADHLKKGAARHRTDIAQLKRRVEAMERQLARIERLLGRAAPAVAARADDTSRALRFSAKRLRAQREKLELSAADFGRLLDVSGPTIYNWEAGKTRPNATQLQAIAALRGIGKRALREKLGA